MPDEPTLGEVVRRFDERFTDVREDIQQLGRRMDEKVDQRIYDLRHEALASRVTTLETLREKDAEKLIATRRWLIGAVIVPLVAILLPMVILLARGSGS
ncbi:hypothetical protein PV755_46590 [Streptomyces caniscabiei]|uniref:Uncharacterized protein n=1 Tax=Streptomyces caniscabiei TaxID=2746961 RepID=A0A927QE37_9ACTN|nr:hypothetical protein [Streptomyces caniscabiei]MBD9723433.1 hypothetical protein [Streptomyces caniscabiei]MDX3516274.1 hypothetical protein [Streptomyces caniscabiei]MDX3725295.1 hypothetical protein [Streptomyces caniscabiei]WEO27003.1 hypothetical protein IHE65_29750 [Streptomyces caniscabiei]